MRRAVIAATVVALALSIAACGGDEARTTERGSTGADLAKSLGCASCHSTNGDRKQGPTWKGLAGSEVTLTDGMTVVADDAYLVRSITDPNAQVVDDFIPIMPDLDVADDDVDALVAYIKELDP